MYPKNTPIALSVVQIEHKNMNMFVTFEQPWVLLYKITQKAIVPAKFLSGQSLKKKTKEKTPTV